MLFAVSYCLPRVVLWFSFWHLELNEVFIYLSSFEDAENVDEFGRVMERIAADITPGMLMLTLCQATRYSYLIGRVNFAYTSGGTKMYS